MKQKKQGLNQLWLSGKALVTVDDDSDVNDEELLPQYQQQEQHITLKQKVKTSISTCHQKYLEASSCKSKQ